MNNNNKIAITKINNDDVKSAVFEALNLINAGNLFINPSMKILIKPNLLAPKKPEKAVTTHPAVLRAVIQWLKQFNPKRIIVADSSGTYLKGITDLAFEVCGIRKVCEEEHIEFIPFERTKCKSYKVESPLILKEFPASRLLEEFDMIINIPKIKTHINTKLTCSIKNMFGTVILGYKRKIHKLCKTEEKLNSALVDVYSVFHPELTIVDGYLCQEGMGPSMGDVVKMNLIIAGYDPVALDTVICQIIDFNPSEISYISKAEEKGLGTSDLKKFEFVGSSIRSVRKKFKKPKTSIKRIIIMNSRLVIEYVYKTLTRQSITFNKLKCDLCYTCSEICPVKAIILPEVLEEGKSLPRWDKRVCIKCYTCAEFCPNKAIELKKNIIKNFLNSWLSIIFFFSILFLIYLIFLLF